MIDPRFRCARGARPQLAATVLSFAIPAAVTRHRSRRRPRHLQHNLSAQTSPATGAGPESVADLAEGLLGAMVNIPRRRPSRGTDGPGARCRCRSFEGLAVQDFFDRFRGTAVVRAGQLPEVQSLGSGFVIDAKEGFVVTNNKSLPMPTTLRSISPMVGAGRRRSSAPTRRPTATLKVDPADHKLTEVKFGDSDKMRIGDWVMAIGNPFGLGGTVTVGIISTCLTATSTPVPMTTSSRPIPPSTGATPAARCSTCMAGSSASALQRSSPTGSSIGIGFSIPTQLARAVWWISCAVRQKPAIGWLGVRIQPVTGDIAEASE